MEPEETLLTIEMNGSVEALRTLMDEIAAQAGNWKRKSDLEDQWALEGLVFHTPEGLPQADVYFALIERDEQLSLTTIQPEDPSSPVSPEDYSTIVQAFHDDVLENVSAEGVEILLEEKETYK